MAGLAWHISIGLSVVTILFPFYPADRRRYKIGNWSGKLNRLLGVQVCVHGDAPKANDNALLLSNHISWLDIFALNAVHTTRFVAKSEVKTWPIIGRLCKKTGTLFIERNKKQDTLRTNQEISAALSDGGLIAIFPEGTTSDGNTLKPFRSSLLQPAIDSLATIQPVYLRYLEADGQRSSAAAYCDDITLGASLWKLLGMQGLSVEIHYLPQIAVTPNDDRRTLTKQIENDIRTLHNKLTLPVSDKSFAHPPGIAGHRPNISH